MAFKQERTAAGWRIYDPDNPAVDVLHADRATAIDKAQAALAQCKEVRYAPQEEHKQPRKATEPEPPAEEQLDYFDSRYLPVADKLLEAHDLTVPERTRAMLARLIAGMRELPADSRHEDKEEARIVLNCEGLVNDKPKWEIVEVEHDSPFILHSIEVVDGKPERKEIKVEPPENTPKKKEPHSPVPALKSARKHLLKLLEYAEHPPTHKERVARRCARLRAAVLSGGSFAAFELALESPNDDSLYGCGGLLDALAAGRVDALELRKWLDRIDRILTRNECWRLGQPSALTRRIVKDGCIVWRAAKRGPEYFQRASYGRETLTGPLIDFLRDLIACCNGTHEWSKKPPRRVPQGCRTLAKMGDSINPSDTAIHKMVVTFWQ